MVGLKLLLINPFLKLVNKFISWGSLLAYSLQLDCHIKANAPNHFEAVWHLDSLSYFDFQSMGEYPSSNRKGVAFFEHSPPATSSLLV